MSLTSETPSLLIQDVGCNVPAPWLGPQTLPLLAHGDFLIPFHSSTLTLLLGHLRLNVPVIGPHICFLVTVPLLPLVSDYVHSSLTSSHGLPDCHRTLRLNRVLLAVLLHQPPSQENLRPCPSSLCPIIPEVPPWPLHQTHTTRS